MAQDESNPTVDMFIALGLCTLYFFAGLIFFHFGESMPFFDALYWAFILNAQTGTLQYLFREVSQNISTSLGKFFVMGYILLGFIVVGYTFAQISQWIFDKQEEFLRSRQESMTRSRLLIYKLISLGIMFMICWVIGGIVYSVFEGWGVLDSFYFSFLTAAAIGETDLYPTSMYSKVIATGLVFLTGFMFTFTLATLFDYWAEVQKEKLAARYFNRSLSIKSLKEMDINSDGKVTKQEFLEYMLVNCELVSQEDIDKIKAKYDQLDKDHSGQLDQDDLDRDRLTSINSGNL